MWCCVVACYLVLPKKIVLPSPKWSQHVQLLRSCAPIRKLSSAESPLRADLKGGQTWNRSELPWIANSQQLWKMDENGSRIIRIACLIEKWGSICRLFFFRCEVVGYFVGFHARWTPTFLEVTYWRHLLVLLGQAQDSQFIALV
jgi:hypothetical protein